MQKPMLPFLILLYFSMRLCLFLSEKKNNLGYNWQFKLECQRLNAVIIQFCTKQTIYNLLYMKKTDRKMRENKKKGKTSTSLKKVLLEEWLVSLVVEVFLNFTGVTVFTVDFCTVFLFFLPSLFPFPFPFNFSFSSPLWLIGYAWNMTSLW